MTDDVMDAFERFEGLAHNPPTYGSYGKWIAELQSAWAKYQRELKWARKNNRAFTQ